MANLKLVEALKSASAFLSQAGVATWNAERIWRDYKDWSLTELLMHYQDNVEPEDWEAFQLILDDIASGTPMQYALGKAYFMEEVFKVTPDTLIPRPETEGLVTRAGLYLDHHPKARILDIGTGTGIIAIMLKKLYPHIEVVATDISKEALQVARENAKRHQVDITFIQSDVFDQVEGEFSLIISNPPYIGQEEVELMDAHVIAYEPHTALFAEQAGYAIYYQIGQELEKYLKSEGQLLLEIGYQQGDALKAYYEEQFPTAAVSVYQDFSACDRYVCVDFKKGRQEDANI